MKASPSSGATHGAADPQARQNELENVPVGGLYVSTRSAPARKRNCDDGRLAVVENAAPRALRHFEQWQWVSLGEHPKPAIGDRLKSGQRTGSRSGR